MKAERNPARNNNHLGGETVEKVKKTLKKGISQRTTVLLVLVGLLAVSSYANYRMSAQSAALQTELPVIRVQGATPTAQPKQGAPTTAPAENSFAAYRDQRGASRAQEIQMLDQMIGDSAASPDTAEQARRQKLELVRGMEQETALEGLLKAKGFEDALVSARSGAVTVVVRRETLSAAEATQILELAMRETGEAARNVKIIPTK